MNVRDLGRFSGPTILLLHDSPVPAQHLERLAMALAHSNRVLLPDLPGYAGSPRRRRPIEDAQAELEAFIRGLGLMSLDVVGLGLGAYRALRLALGVTVRVRRLVSLSGFATLPLDERRRCLAQADVLASGADVCDAYIDRALPPEQRDRDPELVERVRGWVHEVHRETWIVELDAMSRCEDLLPRLRDVRANVLALHGTEDRQVAAARSDEIAAATRHALVERLPCGHLPLDELEDHVIPRIRAFLTF